MDYIRGDTKFVEMWAFGGPKYVELELLDVRASDGIRIHYDMERDGWSICQASTFSWDDTNDPTGACDSDWQEVAFVKSWARKVPGPGDPEYGPKEPRSL